MAWLWSRKPHVRAHVATGLSCLFAACGGVYAIHDNLVNGLVIDHTNWYHLLVFPAYVALVWIVCQWLSYRLFWRHA